MSAMNRARVRVLTRIRESYTDWLVAARADLIPMATVDLFNFNTHPEDISKFQVTTDTVLGGTCMHHILN